MHVGHCKTYQFRGDLVVDIEPVVLRAARDVVPVRGQTHEVLLVNVAGERPGEGRWRVEHLRL